MYHYFTSEYPLPKEPEDLESPSTPASASPTIKRHVPAEVIQLQVDEVVTKSQETGTQNQQNLHRHRGRRFWTNGIPCRENLFDIAIISGSSSGIVGIISRKTFSDGAVWIGDWIRQLSGLDVYQILCWYHLCKRVCEGLSGLGAPPKKREQWQREILGHLWKGNVNNAIALLKSLLPECRVRSRVETLIDYLERKRCLIPDYVTRHEQGLWIASTRKWKSGMTLRSRNDVNIEE
jgi:hypothetical protein